MTKVLLKHGTPAVIIAVIAAAGLMLLVLGPMSMLAALVGGTLAGANFLGLVYIVSRLLDSATESKTKLFLGFVFMTKMAVIGLLFWLVLAKWSMEPLGVVAGIGAAIAGLTFGVARGSSSPEGKAAMEAESARIARELDLGD